VVKEFRVTICSCFGNRGAWQEFCGGLEGYRHSVSIRLTYGHVVRCAGNDVSCCVMSYTVSVEEGGATCSFLLLPVKRDGSMQSPLTNELLTFVTHWAYRLQPFTGITDTCSVR